MKSWLFVILTAYLTCSYADISMRLSDDTIPFGQTFEMILTLDGAQQNEIPDLTPLQDSFEIVATQRSNNYTNINGQAQSSTKWTITLMPLQAGNITIPSLFVGSEQTPNKNIEVSAESSTDDKRLQTGDDAMLLTEVSDKSVYVNQQIIYTVRLFNSMSTRLLDAGYQPPQVDDALLVTLGSGQSSQAVVKGKLYAVEEQQYAIFPQKSGTLTIKPPVFDALIYDSNARKIQAKAQETILTIKPVPELINAKSWLPAQNVRLTEEYSGNRDKMMQGNTFTRIINLQVVGTPAQLLPNVTLESTEQFSVYPETPVTKNAFQQNSLVANSTLKATYLLSHSGDITIPELQIPWFNTRTGKEEIARLPPQHIQVAAVNNNNTLKPKTPTQQAEKKPKPEVKKTKALNFNTTYAWYFTAAMAVVWLLTVLLLWKKPRKTLGKKQLLKQVEKACKSGDNALIQAALLRWAAWQWPDKIILTLSDINHLSDDPVLTKGINYLIQDLYRKQTKAWDKNALWEAVKSYRPLQKKRKKKQSDLPTL